MNPTPDLFTELSSVYQRSLPPPPPPKPLSAFSDFRTSRQDLQRIGSLKPRDWKNSCSPAVKTNFWPQSLQLSSLSWDILLTPLLYFYLIRFCGHLGLIEWGKRVQPKVLLSFADSFRPVRGTSTIAAEQQKSIPLYLTLPGIKSKNQEKWQKTGAGTSNHFVEQQNSLWRFLKAALLPA